MYLGEGQRWGPITYAQHGDDLFIINLFELMGIDKPSYLDVGANHPFAISNTALLYSRGSRGVNVEANPELMAEFERLRPEDTNVNIGVAPQYGVMDFYMFEMGDGLNTFSHSERDKTVASGNPVKAVRPIEVVTLNSVVDQYCGHRWPNLLTIDIEGLDLAVMNSVSIIWPHGPEVICVETRRHETEAMNQAVGKHGYQLCVRLAENLVFVRSDVHQKGY